MPFEVTKPPGDAPSAPPLKVYRIFSPEFGLGSTRNTTPQPGTAPAQLGEVMLPPNCVVPKITLVLAPKISSPRGLDPPVLLFVNVVMIDGFQKPPTNCSR